MSLDLQLANIVCLSGALFAGSVLFIRRYLLLADKRSITHLRLMTDKTFVLTLSSGKTIETELKAQRVIGQHLLVLTFIPRAKAVVKRSRLRNAFHGPITAFITSEHIALRRSSRRLAFQHNAMRRLRVLLNHHYFD